MLENEVRGLELLESLPPEWPVDLLPEIRRGIDGSVGKIIVLDDDPTGTQTVRDLPVLTSWSEEALVEELTTRYPALFILTNSRSLPEPQACALAGDLGRNLRAAARRTGVRPLVISRGDSTLRGHFPAEVDAAARPLAQDGLPYLLVPFFLEGGRYTVGDVHYVREGNRFVPAAQTAFARDAAFGYRHANLRQWVEEKTGGRLPAGEVRAVTLEDIRLGGPRRVAAVLRDVPPSGACIVNAVSYRDIEVLVAALLEIEYEGKGFLYRTAASFVRIRCGMDPDLPLLSRDQLVSDSACGGLFIIGSYVDKTSRQVHELLTRTGITALEVQVGTLLDRDGREAEIARVAALAEDSLRRGEDTAIYTSRELISGKDAASSLGIGAVVSDSLIRIVEAITARPRYLVAKGGITSSDVATKALRVERAMVIGQPLPGVPAWRLGPETRYPGMPYIIFPGNVGEVDALVRLQQDLAAAVDKAE